MAPKTIPEFPPPGTDERELLLRWLGYLRGSVLRNIEGLSDDEARWTPAGTLIPLVGIVNHLTHVEWRWIDGSMRGQEVSRGRRNRPSAHRRRRTEPSWATEATRVPSGLKIRPRVRPLPPCALGESWA